MGSGHTNVPVPACGSQSVLDGWMSRIQERPSGGQYTVQVKYHSVSCGHNTIAPEIAPAMHVAQLTSPCSPLRCGKPECPQLRAARDGRRVAMVIPASFAILCPAIQTDLCSGSLHLRVQGATREMREGSGEVLCTLSCATWLPRGWRPWLAPKSQRFTVSIYLRGSKLSHYFLLPRPHHAPNYRVIATFIMLSRAPRAGCNPGDEAAASRAALC